MVIAKLHRLPACGGVTDLAVCAGFDNADDRTAERRQMSPPEASEAGHLQRLVRSAEIGQMPTHGRSRVGTLLDVVGFSRELDCLQEEALHQLGRVTGVEARPTSEVTEAGGGSLPTAPCGAGHGRRAGCTANPLQLAAHRGPREPAAVLMVPLLEQDRAATECFDMRSLDLGRCLHLR